MMNQYKKAVFDAIMWAQAVENLVRKCALKCVTNGKLSPNNRALEKIKYTFGLGGLVYEIKPCISESLFTRLLCFSKDRNSLAHDAADRYMINVTVEADEETMKMEIWKLEENKRVAGDLYGELLDLHTEFSA